jgi:hypothetical protein
MSEYFRTTFTGEMTNRDGTAIHCPYCRSTRGLSLEGYPGAPGILTHCGRAFALPAEWNARQILIDASFDSRRIRT